MLSFIYEIENTKTCFLASEIKFVPGTDGPNLTVSQNDLYAWCYYESTLDCSHGVKKSLEIHEMPLVFLQRIIKHTPKISQTTKLVAWQECEHEGIPTK